MAVPGAIFTGRQHSSILCRCPDLAGAKATVHPSVCHTLRFYQNEASWDHKIITVSSAKYSTFRIQKAFPEI